MRQLIRQRDGIAALSPDEWRAVEDDPTGAGRAVILPLARWRAEREQWWLWAGRLGVHIGPADRVETLEADLARLALIAVEFTGPSEGRGYSQARVLRDRFGFAGEIRAVGYVKLDQLFFLSRCGFDAFQLSEGVDARQALLALRQFDVAYQPGAAGSPAVRRRPGTALPSAY